MNKVELIEALAPRLGGRQLAAMAVEALVDAVLREVAAGGTVGITGFGTFERVDRAPRTGRNPHTGAAVPIAATSSPRFRPGAYFKEVVADPDRLPTDGLAGVRVGSHGEMAEPEPTSRPSSVRRSSRQERTAGPEPSEQGRPERNGRGQEGADTADAGSADAGSPDASSSGKSRRRTASGTPPTVRARQESPAAPQKGSDAAGGTETAGGGSREVKAPGGRGPSGGQDITMGMITAKKAQLARVKNDDVVAEESSSTKKGSGKDKDTKKGAKDEKGAAGAKSRSKKGKKGKKSKKKSKGS